MDIFGIKARKQNAYFAEVMLRDKELLVDARRVIQLQANQIYQLEQEISYLKMINGMKDLDYPNSTKEA